MNFLRETRGMAPGNTLAVLATTAAGLLAVLLPPPANASLDPVGYNPDKYPTRGCFWTGPFERKNPKTNVAFPGTEITYWAAKFVTPPGSKLTLKGRFPHARYSSLNSYDNEGASQSSLPDRQIKADRGSTNPTLPGKNRKAAKRSYTVDVLGQAPPLAPAGNTLYAKPTPDGYQVVIYRVYVPDRGRDLDGGTGLPKPTLRLADGRILSGGDLCKEMNAIHYFPPTKMPQATYDNLVNWPGKDPIINPAENPLQFSRYWNRESSLARYKTPAEQANIWRNTREPKYRGTQYDNSDARYMTSAFSTTFGKVVVLKGKLPTTPRTLKGQKKMTSGQLVLWDMCVIQSLVTTKTWDCVFDEQLPLRGGKKRQYTIVLSSKKDRPRNAKTRCGVHWMSMDPKGDGAGRTYIGQLLTRNVLPARSFKRSSWAVDSPFPTDAIGTMGPYYPKGTYTSKKRFQRLGCDTKVKKGKKSKKKRG